MTFVQTNRVEDKVNEPSIEQSIRKEFDETFESVKEFGVFLNLYVETVT